MTDPPEPTEVDIWLADLEAGTGPSERRTRRAAAQQALRRVLAGYIDEDPERIELRRGRHGKPALLASEPALRFNLSHSRGIALIAVAVDREVGVDVEATDRPRDFLRLAERGLRAEEVEAIRSARPVDRGAAFYAAWVRREAVAKCLGVGLGAPPPAGPVAVSELDVGAGHAAALAVAGSAVGRLRRRSLPPA